MLIGEPHTAPDRSRSNYSVFSCGIAIGTHFLF